MIQCIFFIQILSIIIDDRASKLLFLFSLQLTHTERTQTTSSPQYSFTTRFYMITIKFSTSAANALIINIIIFHFLRIEYHDPPRSPLSARVVLVCEKSTKHRLPDQCVSGGKYPGNSADLMMGVKYRKKPVSELRQFEITFDLTGGGYKARFDANWNRNVGSHHDGPNLNGPFTTYGPIADLVPSFHEPSTTCNQLLRLIHDPNFRAAHVRPN